jgi:hypothetical protein
MFSCGWSGKMPLLPKTPFWKEVEQKIPSVNFVLKTKQSIIFSSLVLLQNMCGAM